MLKLTGFLMMLLALAGAASAEIAPVPEIDGSTVVSGVALVCGAILIARSRKR